jgi:hypothetical protein
VAAVALVRAEFSGFRAHEATPGFSLLRSISTHLTDNLKDDIREAVRKALPDPVDELKGCAFVCKSRAHPPRPDGSQTPDAKALAAAVELLAKEHEFQDLRELTVDTVVRHNVPKCW